MRFKYQILPGIIAIVTAMITNNQLSGQSFSIKGKLTDSGGGPVAAGSVILLAAKDSTFVKGNISDIESGTFVIGGVPGGNYIMLIQHLLYQNKYLKTSVNQQTVDLGTVILENKANKLEEVSIKASRPIVKIKDNVLLYNAKAISEKYIRSNALEVLGDIPGVMLKNDNIELLGSRDLNIAINGKPTTMSLEQVTAMLRAMPNDKVKEIQVMYAAPAKYNVKGALINLIMSSARENELNGSLSAGYQQRKAPGGNTNINLQYATKKWNIDFLYNGEYEEVNTTDYMDIKHLYKGTLYHILQHDSGPDKTFEHNIQISSGHTLTDKSKVTFSYSGNFTTDNNLKETITQYYTSSDTSREHTHISEDSPENLHNIKLDYSLGNKLNAGIDYTLYKNPSTQKYRDTSDDMTSIFKTQSNQQAGKLLGYINWTSPLQGNSTLSYGVNYAYSTNDNSFNYYNYLNNAYIRNEGQSSSNHYEEFDVSAFAGWSKQFNSQLSVDFSLKGEYDKTIKDTAGTTKTLWGNFNAYPTANISYLADTNAKHIFQLSLESYPTYPSYWEISPTTWYLNDYTLIKGNPELQPSRTYKAQFNYIFHRKYVVTLSYEYVSKMISQMPYASTETFNTIFQDQNLDFDKNLILAFVLPFNLSRHIQINPTLGALHRHMKKKGAEGTNFDRSANTCFVQADNSVTLSEKHGIKLNISGYYYSSLIQAIYD